MTFKKKLQGRPLGHPLHPITIHLPLGFWFIGLLLDVFSATSSGEQWMLEGALWCLLLGTAVAVISAITGFADWLDIRSDHVAESSALWHLGLMVLAVAVFAVDTYVHRYSFLQPRTIHMGVVLSALGYAISIVGGYLGGKMVYDDGVGVGRHRRSSEMPRTTHKEPLHNATTSLPDEHAIAPEKCLAEGGSIRAEINGTVIAVMKSGGKIYAVQEFCTHRCGPLSEGCMANGQVECPWHKSRFDLATGQPTHGPAKVELKTYEIRMEEGIIYVRTPSGARGGSERRNPAESPTTSRDGKRAGAPDRERSELP